MSSAWAVVTGASSGLGVAFAERIAAEGVGVVLVARREDKLTEVAADLHRRFGIDTEVVATDLGTTEGVNRVIAAMETRELAYLVNNAGFGTLGAFAEADHDRLAAELNLNALALTRLSHSAASAMLARGRGAIINVASTAAFQPIPMMGVYAASKAYVLRLSIALWEELKPTGVRVIAICPGPTETEFFANAGNGDVMAKRRTPEQVVETTFAGLKRHRPYVVDGAGNAVLAFANRLAPASLQARIARYIATH